MMHKKVPADRHGNNLDVLVSCFFCNNVFSQNDFMMLEKQEHRTALHVTCPKCKTSSLIFISAVPEGIVSIGMATDLDKEEVREAFNKKAISVDDIIEAYRLLSQNKKGISEILK